MGAMGPKYLAIYRHDAAGDERAAKVRFNELV